MKNNDVIMLHGHESPRWLLENAGPVIKYRVANELAKEKNHKEIDSLRKALLEDGLVRLWLNRLQPKFGRNDLHGTKTENYENVMGKLYDFGLRKGMKALDDRTEPFLDWLAEQVKLPNVGYFPVLYRILAAAFLAMTGYSENDAVKNCIVKRLETVYPFAKKADLSNVYIPQDSFRGFPRAFRNAPLINPEIYPNDEFKLPWIHDVNAFLHSPFIMEDAQLRQKAETIIEFILKPEYQRLKPGYGTIRHESGRYYAMGWSVQVPGFFDSGVDSRDFGRFLLLLSVLGRSQKARRHEWFTRSVSLLESYRIDGGLYCFPREFLPEKQTGPWVLGTRMGLEANRRNNKAIVCESTFRVLKITSNQPKI